MGYYPSQYGGPMNGMGGNMRPPYGAPNGMPGGMAYGGMRPPMYQNNYYNNNYGNYGMPMMQQPQPPMYPGPGRGMGRGRAQPAGRMVRNFEAVLCCNCVCKVYNYLNYYSIWA